MYVKQTWANGTAGATPISAARLNYIEEGIAAADPAIPADLTLYVGTGPLASDANAGTSPGRPKATLAAATAALPSGGVIQLLAGTYTLTLTSHPVDPAYKVGAVVYANTIIRGVGNKTVLRFANSQPSGYGLMNYNIAAGGDEGIVFEDFLIDGNNVNQTTGIHHGITLLRAQDCKFNRVWVKNCRGTAISGINENFHLDVQLSSSINFIDCNVFGTAGSTASGFSANGSTDITYIGCRAWGMSVCNGFTHNACRGITHVGCQAFLNTEHGFNSEVSDDVLYDVCTGGGRATTANLSYPYTATQSLGNVSHGFAIYDSTAVQFVNCSGVRNAYGIGWSGTAASGRITGGNFSNNTAVGISFISDAEKRVMITGTPIVSGNTSSPYALTSGFMNGPGLVTAPAVPASNVALTNPLPFNATIVITGGSVNFITVDGGTVLAAVQTVRLPFGKSITLNYASAPTWVWFAE